MSARRERQGLGTILVAGLEVLLRLEGVGVVVLYPAENGRAPSFWASIGYAAPAEGESFLPAEELVPHTSGGALWPEFDTGTQRALPRWEKEITEPMAESASPCDAGAERQFVALAPGSAKVHGTGGKKQVSRIAGEKLRAATAALKAQRSHWKALVADCISGELPGLLTCTGSHGR
eukprot:NODE_635_length_2876_cov_6.845762.p2 GENE.NODE_635_length_2876_cov_6.845762~~NODE_635_length_2876_cov_6.845762.p2  ORF type:complete len:177 (-),score=54.62 NODE_635_length_2876_cov_6.845762:600-1130(-)